MQINLSEEMIQVVAGLLRQLDHEQLESVQFCETNGHQAANYFDALEQELTGQIAAYQKEVAELHAEIRILNKLAERCTKLHGRSKCPRAGFSSRAS